MALVESFLIGVGWTLGRFVGEALVLLIIIGLLCWLLRR
jgi:hypothetical protein